MEDGEREREVGLNVVGGEEDQMAVSVEKKNGGGKGRKWKRTGGKKG